MKTVEKELTEEEVNQIIEWEAQALGDAIGNCLELNDNFLDRYCSEDLKEALLPIPERDREFHLESFIGDWRELSGYDCGADINLPVGEIENQDENVDFYYIACDGIAFKVDIEGLKKAWQDWNEE